MLNSLRSQILFIVVLVALLAVIVAFYPLHKEVRNIVVNSEKKAVENVSVYIRLSLKDKFDRYLHKKYKSFSRAIKGVKRKANEIKRYTRGDVGSIINYINNQDMIYGIMLIDKSGEVFFSTDVLFEYKNINTFYNLTGKKIKKIYYGDKLSRNGQFAGVCLGPEGKKCIIGYFIPVLENRTLSVFFSKDKFIDKIQEKTEEAINELKKIINELPLSRGGVVVVFNEDGKNLICHDNKKEICSNNNWLQEIIEKGKANIGKDVEIEVDIEKDESNSSRTRFSLFTEYFKGFDWYFARVLPADELEKPATDLVWKLFLIIISTAFLAVGLFVFLTSRITRPFAILSRRMARVPEHDFTGDDHSELLDGLPVSAHNEAGQLAKNFFFMVEELSGSIKQLVEVTAANERIETELNVARGIQLGVLPKDFSEPKRKAIDLYAYLEPAREIGGDLYDFFFVDDDHLCFTVGDVADKGVPAALFMFCAKKVISSCVLKGGTDRLSPAVIMGEINEMLCKDNASFTFITLFIGILNVKSGELLYANGGHVPPIFVDCGGEPKYRKELSGPVVGVLPGMQYKDIKAALQPGGAVFLCTDGVTEAMNEKGQLFGDKRLLGDFSCMKDKSCKEVVEGILYEVRMHAGTIPQSDDIAMLMLRWGVKGKNYENHI
ncbi:MAG: HAMP domain-containing protein [Candidatus Electrothrix sp. AUS4]|nr:HAMP domain-containing protein [Candidatus Electrothrix sp. AUS4]